ncbi:hypothetical protein V1502_12615 [Bacillus sp. SCS-153A]
MNFIKKLIGRKSNEASGCCRIEITEEESPKANSFCCRTDDQESC